jgi:hypothetical protein
MHWPALTRSPNLCVAQGRQFAEPGDVSRSAGTTHSPRITVADMDAVTAFGLFAITAMLVFYALEERSPWYVLAFAGACALASAYGFLQGAWPFGIVEAIWALVAVRRWRSRGTHR